MSNILPHSVKNFDGTRHLLRGDLIFSQNYCTVIIKWTKTLQDRQHSRTISIPHLGDSILCPIAALQSIFQKFPAEKNSPLFLQFKQGAFLPLMDSIARKHLKQVSTLLNIHPPPPPLDLPFISEICHYMGFLQWCTNAPNYATRYLE